MRGGVLRDAVMLLEHTVPARSSTKTIPAWSRAEIGRAGMQSAQHCEGSPSSSVRSSRQRLSGMDAMVDSIDGRASGRHSSSSIRSSLLSMLKAAGSQGRQSHSSVLLQDCDKNGDEDDDDAAPCEAAKTMTALGGTTLLCKSMMGGGVSA